MTEPAEAGTAAPETAPEAPQPPPPGTPDHFKATVESLRAKWGARDGGTLPSEPEREPEETAVAEGEAPAEEAEEQEPAAEEEQAEEQVEEPEKPAQDSDYWMKVLEKEREIERKAAETKTMEESLGDLVKVKELLASGDKFGALEAAGINFDELVDAVVKGDAPSKPDKPPEVDRVAELEERLTRYEIERLDSQLIQTVRADVETDEGFEVLRRVPGWDNEVKEYMILMAQRGEVVTAKSAATALQTFVRQDLEQKARAALQLIPELRDELFSADREAAAQPASPNREGVEGQAAKKAPVSVPNGAVGAGVTSPPKSDEEFRAAALAAARRQWASR